MIKSIKYQRQHSLSDPNNKYVVITTEVENEKRNCHEDHPDVKEWVAEGNTIEPADEK